MSTPVHKFIKIIQKVSESQEFGPGESATSSGIFSYFLLLYRQLYKYVFQELTLQKAGGYLIVRRTVLLFLGNMLPESTISMS